MLVSVVIPNYNYAEYLAETISSVVGQTWEELELNIIDDGSDDASVNVIQELKSKVKTRFKRFIDINLPSNSGKLSALMHL